MTDTRKLGKERRTEIKFSRLRMARATLSMKARIAAGIMGMELEKYIKGERSESVVPEASKESAERLLEMAQRARQSSETHRGIGSRSLRARLPFRRPRCKNCR